jgi:hypothetical protein
MPTTHRDLKDSTNEICLHMKRTWNGIDFLMLFIAFIRPGGEWQIHEPIYGD